MRIPSAILIGILAVAAISNAAAKQRGPAYTPGSVKLRIDENRLEFTHGDRTLRYQFSDRIVRVQLNPAFPVAAVFMATRETDVAAADYKQQTGIELPLHYQVDRVAFVAVDQTRQSPAEPLEQWFGQVFSPDGRYAVIQQDRWAGPAAIPVNKLFATKKIQRLYLGALVKDSACTPAPIHETVGWTGSATYEFKQIRCASFMLYRTALALGTVTLIAKGACNDVQGCGPKSRAE